MTLQALLIHALLLLLFDGHLDGLKLSETWILMYALLVYGFLISQPHCPERSPQITSTWL